MRASPRCRPQAATTEQGGGGDVRFDSQSSAQACEGLGPAKPFIPSGTYGAMGGGSMSALLGGSSAGVWTVMLADTAVEDRGFFSQLRLHLYRPFGARPASPFRSASPALMGKHLCASPARRPPCTWY
jgi:hypothetical protein